MYSKSFELNCEVWLWHDQCLQSKTNSWRPWAAVFVSALPSQAGLYLSICCCAQLLTFPSHISVTVSVINAQVICSLYVCKLKLENISHAAIIACKDSSRLCKIICNVDDFCAEKWEKWSVLVTCVKFTSIFRSPQLGRACQSNNNAPNRFRLCCSFMSPDCHSERYQGFQMSDMMSEEA